MAADQLTKAPGFHDPETATQTGTILQELWAADMLVGLQLGRARLGSGDPNNFSSLQRTQALWALELLYEAIVFGFGRAYCEDGPQRAVEAGLDIAAILDEREIELAVLHSDLESVWGS